MSLASGHSVAREDTPAFYAWCNESARIEVFSESLSALTRPWGLCSLFVSSAWRDAVPVADIAAALRPAFSAEGYISASFNVMVPSGRLLDFGGQLSSDLAICKGATGPIEISPFDKVELFPRCPAVGVPGSARSIEVESAITSLLFQADVEDLLLRLCEPSAPSRVVTGGCTSRRHWGAPIEMNATYHPVATDIARDLALSWVLLHDRERMELVAGMPLAALHARVDAAPHGARVTVKGRAELSREAVLKVLNTSPAMLLDAIEASVLPDDEWRAVEFVATEVIQSMRTGVPVCEVDVATRRHVRFLEHHAPFHIRRLQSGGVLLATHPYRTLWPLWEDALHLLGITL